MLQTPLERNEMIDAQEMQFEAEPRQLIQFESHSDVK